MCDCKDRHQRCSCGSEDCRCSSSSCGCSCGCGESCSCGGIRFQRRYQTKAEEIAELEAYLGELKTEVQAVEERLADLRR